jgi:hypothetical protein
VLTQIAVAVFMLIYTAPALAVPAEMCPTTVRATGVSLTYSLGVAVFGGFTPAIIAALTFAWVCFALSSAQPGARPTMPRGPRSRAHRGRRTGAPVRAKTTGRWSRPSSHN